MLVYPLQEVNTQQLKIIMSDFKVTNMPWMLNNLQFICKLKTAFPFMQSDRTELSRQKQSLKHRCKGSACP